MTLPGRLGAQRSEVSTEARGSKSEPVKIGGPKLHCLLRYTHAPLDSFAPGGRPAACPSRAAAHLRPKPLLCDPSPLASACLTTCGGQRLAAFALGGRALHLALGPAWLACSSSTAKEGGLQLAASLAQGSWQPDGQQAAPPQLPACPPAGACH